MVNISCTIWDIIAPCVGFLFVLPIYLQQRFGGCCMLPQRFQASNVHEKMQPAMSTQKTKPRSRKHSQHSITYKVISFYLSLIACNSHLFHSYVILNSAWLSYTVEHASTKKRNRDSTFQRGLPWSWFFRQS